MSDVLHLAEILYLPADGEGKGPIGEELLHWVNTFDRAPTKEDGIELASHALPYEAEKLFWSYVPRCILRGLFGTAATLIQSMREHPVPFVQQQASSIASLLSSFPRSTQFSTANEFIQSVHRYRRSVRDTLSDMEVSFDEEELWLSASRKKGKATAPKALPEDDRWGWLARFQVLLKLLLGDEEVVLDQAEDWAEALACWGVLVRPSLGRDDLQ